MIINIEQRVVSASFEHLANLVPVNMYTVPKYPKFHTQDRCA